MAAENLCVYAVGGKPEGRFTVFGAGEMFEKTSAEYKLSRNAKHSNYLYGDIYHTQNVNIQQ